MIVDYCFKVMGKELPVDHGYALYSALSHSFPEIHALPDVGIHPIGGSTVGCAPRRMRLGATSRLRIRASTDLAPLMVRLAGHRLSLGADSLQIGVPEIRPLIPAESLKARLVTIKGFTDPGPFLEAIARQLGALGVAARALVGKRRTTNIAGKEIVGFQVSLADLAPDSSILAQAQGLGGRRAMGCGLFDPIAAADK